MDVLLLEKDVDVELLELSYILEAINGKKGRMHFDDMRSIDKMRVIEKKGYRSVCTPRADIEAAFKKYMGL